MYKKNIIGAVKIILLLFFSSYAYAKNVLIIGGNRGIGLALVETYIGAGDNVFVTYRDVAKSEELLKIKNERLKVSQIDLLQKDAIEQIKNNFGDKELDIIIYNAGMFGYKSNRGPVLDSEDWLYSFQVNVVSFVQLSYAMVENLLDGQDKKIVAISSRRGSNAVNIQDGYVGRYSYRSSKAALNSAGVALADDLRKHHISVYLLHPGRVATEMTKYQGITPAESAKNIKRVIDNMQLEHSGTFLDVGTGKILPW